MANADTRRRVVDGAFVAVAKSALDEDASALSAVLLVAASTIARRLPHARLTVATTREADGGPPWHGERAFSGESPDLGAQVVARAFAPCAVAAPEYHDYEIDPEHGYRLDAEIERTAYAVLRRGEREPRIVGGPVRAWFEDLPFYEDAALAARERDAREVLLFDLVSASPADDDARRVLADHLLDRGDPLGEYVSLALAAADPDRLAELERLHRAAWLGPLAAIAPREHVRFSRGFPSALSVYAGDLRVVEQVSHAWQWGTVETLRFLPQSITFVSHAMRSLRDVGPLDRDGLHALGRAAGVVPVERLHLVEVSPQTQRELAALDLPRMRQLAIGSLDDTSGAPLAPDALAILMASPLWSRLERIELPAASRSQEPAWRSVCDRAGKTVRFGPSPASR